MSSSGRVVEGRRFFVVNSEGEISLVVEQSTRIPGESAESPGRLTPPILVFVDHTGTLTPLGGGRYLCVETGDILTAFLT